VPSTNQSDHQQPPPTKAERVEDLPLIVEQLLDQLDDLQQAVDAQQRLITVLTSRVTALEHQPHHE
jgi:chromosome condensin MukBEF ATPase and DNA-binding subunit MukB